MAKLHEMTSIKPITRLSALTLKESYNEAKFLDQNPAQLKRYSLSARNREIVDLINASSGNAKLLHRMKQTFKCRRTNAGVGLEDVNHDKLLYMTWNAKEVTQSVISEYPQAYLREIADKAIQRPAVGGKKTSIDSYFQFLVNHIKSKTFWVVPKVVLLWIGDSRLENGTITFMPGGFFVIIDGQTQCIARHLVAAKGLHCNDIIDVEVLLGQ